MFRNGLAVRTRWLAGLVLAASIGCQTPMQSIPLDVRPDSVELFVNGQRVAPIPRALDLRPDTAYVLLFKRDGYRAEQVVLDSIDLGGSARLHPGRVSVSLAPIVPTGRSVTIEGDGLER
jgi:hypothetical protein